MKTDKFIGWALIIFGIVLFFCLTHNQQATTKQYVGAGFAALLYITIGIISFKPDKYV